MAEYDLDAFVRLLAQEGSLIERRDARIIYRGLRSYCVREDRIPGDDTDVDDRGAYSPFVLDHMLHVAMRRVACEEDLMFPSTVCYQPSTTPLSGKTWSTLVDSLYRDQHSAADVYALATPYRDITNEESLARVYMDICPTLIDRYARLASAGLVTNEDTSTTVFRAQCQRVVTEKIATEMRLVQMLLVRQGTSLHDDEFRSFAMVDLLRSGYAVFHQQFVSLNKGLSIVSQKVQHGTYQCNVGG